MDQEESKIEDIAMMNGIYLNGPDYYVRELRERRLGDYAPQPLEPKPVVDGPACPCCGNAINDDMKFCPECGSVLKPE